MQDWFSLSDTLSQRDPDEERINIPSNPNHIWNYRMHKTIEEVTCDNLFKNSLKAIPIKGLFVLNPFSLSILFYSITF